MKLLDFFKANYTCTNHCTSAQANKIKTKEGCWWYRTYPKEYTFALAQGWLNMDLYPNPVCAGLSTSGHTMMRQLKGDFT